MNIATQKFIPTQLNIDSCSICQLRCPTCHQTTGEKPIFGKGYLKFSDFKKIIDDNPQINFVEFQSNGETFLNPELLDIIRFSFEKDVILSCMAGSNFNYVKEDVLEGLVKYKFKRIKCSIDGASNDTYTQYRIGGNFNNVIDNIKKLNEYKNKYNSDYPELTWQFVVFGHNEHEIPLARKMAESLNMKFILRMSWDTKISPIRDVKFVKQQTGWPVVTREEYEKFTGNDHQRYSCLELWHQPRINWNGELLGCDMNGWGNFGGNVFKDGYITVVNNPKINYARKMLLGKVKPKADIPCFRCKLFIKNKENNNYLTLKEIEPKWYKSNSLFKSAHFIYDAIGIKKIRNEYFQ